MQFSIHLHLGIVQLLGLILLAFTATLVYKAFLNIPSERHMEGAGGAAFILVLGWLLVLYFGGFFA